MLGVRAAGHDEGDLLVLLDVDFDLLGVLAKVNGIERLLHVGFGLTSGEDDGGLGVSRESRLQNAREFRVPEVDEVVFLELGVLAKLLDDLRECEEGLVDVFALLEPVALGVGLGDAFGAGQVYEVELRSEGALLDPSRSGAPVDTDDLDLENGVGARRLFVHVCLGERLLLVADHQQPQNVFDALHFLPSQAFYFRSLVLAYRSHVQRDSAVGQQVVYELVVDLQVRHTYLVLHALPQCLAFQAKLLVDRLQRESDQAGVLIRAAHRVSLA